MAKLPKELTPELLSLVLNNEIRVFEHKDNNIEYIEGYEHGYLDADWQSINLDTLGRLCKKWCYEQGILLESGNTYCTIIDMSETSVMNLGDERYVETTELEAIIKATVWVAKEKGLI